MIGDYIVVAVVFGLAAGYIAILHHFWLRDAFQEESQQNDPAEEVSTCDSAAVPCNISNT